MFQPLAKQKTGISLAAQKERIHPWALAHGFEILGIFKDAGISGGKTDNRPGLQRATERACKEKAALVVYSLSRLARSTCDALEISEKLDKAGADLVSLSEQIDTTSAAGKMVFRMLAVLAEFERDLVSERTKMALAYLRIQGKRISHEVPFGYDDPGTGELVENHQEQKTLSLILRLRRKGLRLRKIADELERRGINTKNGNKTWSPFHHPGHPQTGGGMTGQKEDLDRLADLLSGVGPERIEKALRKSTAIHIRVSEAGKQLSRRRPSDSG